MEPSKLSGARGASIAGYFGTALMPLTWDQSTPVPVTPNPDGTDRTPVFQPADFGQGERTVITSGGFDLKARFTRRAGAIARLQELTDRAFDDRELAFVLVCGDPGMGKSRMVSELVAR